MGRSREHCGSGADRPRSSPQEAEGTVVLLAGDRVVLRLPAGAGAETLRARVLARVTTTSIAARRRATVVYRNDREQTVRRVLAVARRGGGRVQVVRRPLAARVEAPALRQSLPNTCESAALSILLATRGVRAAQDGLQADLPRSGPLDPTGTGDDRTWGDPELGYVGRGAGGGVAGGFGVYQRPVIELAARRGVRLDDLSGADASTVYRRLLSGRAVMAWVGLSDGPYGRWRSPQGRPVEVNFGEHTVVLAGVQRDGAIRVSNPLQGTIERWSRERFETMWTRLDRRAVGA